MSANSVLDAVLTTTVWKERILQESTDPPPLDPFAQWWATGQKLPLIDCTERKLAPNAVCRGSTNKSLKAWTGPLPEPKSHEEEPETESQPEERETEEGGGE